MRISICLKRLSAVAAFGLLLLVAGSVQAGPMFTYDPARSSVTVTPTGAISVFGEVDAQVNQDENIQFELSTIGQLFEFDFLTFTGTGAFIGTADVEATLAFSTPSPATGTGSGNGRAFNVFGFLSAGNLTWTTQPGLVTFSDGTAVDLSFANASQRPSFGSLSLSVAATTNLQAIPEPSMLALMGIGLVGAGFVARRRRIS